MKNIRSKKLIKPQLQVGLISVFLLIATGAVLVQAVVLNTTIMQASAQMSGNGQELFTIWPGLLWKNVLFTFFLLVPSTLVIGTLATFRIAGPLYRLEMHLKQIIRGERPAPCSLRKHDALQDFCQLLNEAVATLSRGPESGRPTLVQEPAERSVPSVDDIAPARPTTPSEQAGAHPPSEHERSA